MISLKIGETDVGEDFRNSTYWACVSKSFSRVTCRQHAALLSSGWSANMGLFGKEPSMRQTAVSINSDRDQGDHPLKCQGEGKGCKGCAARSADCTIFSMSAYHTPHCPPPCQYFCWTEGRKKESTNEGRETRREASHVLLPKLCDASCLYVFQMRTLRADGSASKTPRIIS